MNREEALHTLGLEEGASESDIKAAYREMAQILHPDRFASNKKLQDRSTEQFKRLQEAYEYLTTGRGAQGARTSAAGSSPSARQTATSSRTSASAERDARLAGIAAARVQLVYQKDLALDERRNGLIMAVVGALAAFGLRRFAFVAAIASAAAVWGIVQVLSSQRTINTINEHLEKLESEKNALKDN